jgi:nucleotide-binding universal stress UspA family protein
MPSYATIMVHVDADRNSDRRVRLAAGLARRFHCALIGVAGWSLRPAFALDDPNNTGRNDQEREVMAALLDETERKFRSSAGQVEHIEWRGVLDYVIDLVPREARAADLIVIGREHVPGDLFYSLDPGVMTLRAGRPVLVVPETADSLQAQSVVVAWKDTREARRAVRDALPFLQEAQSVTVAEIGEAGVHPANQEHLDDVATYLRRHNIVATARTYPHGQDPVGVELVRIAKDQKADLIVAGAYGHSRLGEWIFGGVTRDLLSASSLCCLFSH